MTLPPGALLTLALLCAGFSSAQAPAQDAGAAAAAAQTPAQDAAPAVASTTATDDSPPLRVGGSIHPPRVLEHPMPQPTEDAVQHRVGGSVTLAFVIERDGSTSHIQVVRALGYGLDEAAVDAVSRWKFAPATDGDQPVRVQGAASVHFQPR